MPSSDDIILPIEKGFSDGDKSVWPQDPRYNEADPGTYQKKLAMQWIQSSGAQEIGKLRAGFLYPHLRSAFGLFLLLFHLFRVLCCVGDSQVHFLSVFWKVAFLLGVCCYSGIGFLSSG